jgi:hypothetical protein
MRKNTDLGEAPEIIPRKALSVNRYVEDFYTAGFPYYDGVGVFSEPAIGAELIVLSEPENWYDNYAAALYFKQRALGYIPQGKNKYISKFLNFGHTDIFDVKINRVSSAEHPEQQISVGVRIKGSVQKNI